METAQKRDACRGELFWFRKNLSNRRVSKMAKKDEPEYELMTINQIINGNGSFPGIVPLIFSYLSSIDMDPYTHVKILKYLQLIQNRASGKSLTAASWIRQEVLNHPEYKYVSVFFFNYVKIYSLLISFFFSEKTQLLQSR